MYRISWTGPKAEREDAGKVGEERRLIATRSRVVGDDSTSDRHSTSPSEPPNITADVQSLACFRRVSPAPRASSGTGRFARSVTLEDARSGPFSTSDRSPSAAGGCPLPPAITFHSRTSHTWSKRKGPTVSAPG